MVPDERITKARQEMFQSDRRNFDDICFSIYLCQFCNKEKFDLTLLPIIEKEKYSIGDIRQIHELTLERIFDADFDFLHEKRNCDCTEKSIFELKRVIYCYEQDGLDFHNYIDNPFETIKKIQINLIETLPPAKFLFFDTETTGLPKNWKDSYKQVNNWPRLVQIAWISADVNGNIFDQQSYIIKPNGFSIPEYASNIHKISTNKATLLGHELEFVLSQFNDCLNRSDILVAHNMDFDINIVASEMFRLQMDSEIFAKEQICTMKSTINFCRLSSNYGYKFPKLSELYFKLFNDSFEEAHDASVDINATFKCFYELIKNQIIKI
jgi:DNA polymerase-3 subunit epsilon